MGKMYYERTQNIAAFRGCNFSCVYCVFGKMLKLSQCGACRTFTPHSHLESLNHKPLKSLKNSFISIGLSSDISFMPVEDFWQIIEYCRKWKDRTFLIQSKNPVYFLRFQEMIAPLRIPDNVILGTTIESDTIYWKDRIGQMPNELHHYRRISQAPYPEKRYEAMLKLTCKKAVTIEPIMDFDVGTLLYWMKRIVPKFIYVGYVNDGKHGKRLRLPEPPLEKTLELIQRLRESGIEVREKTIRKSWWE